MRSSVESKIENDYIEIILNHCLEIARGECSITFDEISAIGSEKHAQILYGLYCMNEEIVSSREEEVQNVKNEFEANRLRDKNQELEQFAFKASHDLKEPIRTIFSFSQLLKNIIGDNADPKAISYIDYIQISAKRMTDMITHLLDYARFGNKSNFSNFDTHILVQNVNFDLITQIQKAKGKLIVGSLPKIIGDEMLLRLLFQNLISNSLKFRKEEVDPIIQITSSQTKSHFVFSIKDNGIGIKKRDIETLFDIFARGETGDMEYEGIGIGLAHCKKIVELHRGEIWCKSELGSGTEFYFTISKSLAVLNK